MTKLSPNTAFLIHLALYGVVNAGLAAANLMQASGAGEAWSPWFVWPLVGWGIGVAAHGLALVLNRLGEGGGLLAEAPVRGVAVHLFVYVAVNASLIVANLMTGPGALWFVWPLLGWGAGLAVHAWLAYRAVLRRTAERYANEQRVLQEMQLERIAAEIAAAMPPAEEAAPAKRKQAPAKKTAAGRKTPAKSRTAAKSAAGKKSPARTPAARKPAAKTQKPAAQKEKRT